MNKCKASAFKNLDLKKSNFLEKKMYPILDTRVECKDNIDQITFSDKRCWNITRLECKD